MKNKKKLKFFLMATVISYFSLIGNSFAQQVIYKNCVVPENLLAHCNINDIVCCEQGSNGQCSAVSLDNGACSSGLCCGNNLGFCYPEACDVTKQPDLNRRKQIHKDLKENNDVTADLE